MGDSRQLVVAPRWLITNEVEEACQAIVRSRRVREEREEREAEERESVEETKRAYRSAARS